MTTWQQCEPCNGTGYEICDNPDHNFITAVGHEIGRLGCPLCGYDKQHRIMNSPCFNCSGKGIIGEGK